MACNGVLPLPNKITPSKKKQKTKTVTPSRPKVFNTPTQTFKLLPVLKLFAPPVRLETNKPLIG